MHIAIDLRWMHPGVAGGIENLSRSFLNHLLRLDGVNYYSILAPAEIQYDFDLRGSPNFRFVRTHGPVHDWRHLWGRISRSLHKASSQRYTNGEALPYAHRRQVDVVLSLSGYIHIDAYPLRNVVVVPDLQHEYHPEFFPPEVLEERARVFGEAIRRADHLIAISEFTRQTVLERYAIAPERIDTVHPAADPVFSPDTRLGLDRSRILRKYSLSEGEFLFFPANTWAHKNHQGLLETLALLRDAYHLTPPLVCTGTAKEAQPAIAQTIRRLRLEAQVRFLGYCPLEDLPLLYEGAAALVFPSFFEGFGIPLLEAMSRDCPIVCSNATSLPEIAGDAALLVDPRAPREFAAAISRLLTDPVLRRTLIARGRQQVKKFSWRRFTVDTVRLVHRVAEMSRGQGRQ